nr:hypothetical protein [Paraburkholderia sp. BL8N3]
MYRILGLKCGGRAVRLGFSLFPGGDDSLKSMFGGAPPFIPKIEQSASERLSIQGDIEWQR